MENLSKGLTGSVEIVDPYTDLAEITSDDFRNDAEAYEFFIENVGLDRLTDLVRQSVQESSRDLRLIGFSIGASAVWNVCADGLLQINHAVCFYGSQIRRSADLTPTSPVHLVFPDHEHHFDVKRLGNQLKTTPGVSVQFVPHSHGFMNKQSDAFNRHAYELFRRKLTARQAWTDSINGLAASEQ